MTEKIQQFQTACQAYLNTLGITDLRNYGREVGVARPTAKNKETLVSEIIAILSGELAPIPVSRQGAPVKNDRVDERVPAKIMQLKRDYLDNRVGVSTGMSSARGEYIRFGAEGSPLPGKFTGQVDCSDGSNKVILLSKSGWEEQVSISDFWMKRFHLREGDILTCSLTKTSKGKEVSAVERVNEIWEEAPDNRPLFDEEAVGNPTQRIKVYSERQYNTPGLKYAEWVLPIVKGQRGGVISVPKAGKTRILIQLAAAINALNDGVEVYALLIDQSLELISEFYRAVPKENLFYTTYEDDAEKQVFVAEFLLKRLKRRVEMGKDVCLIVDSFNALARAFNDTDASSGGKTLVGGLEVKTVRYVKKYFGSGRSLARGGSLTVLGAISEDTGNPFDDVIAAELSSLANFELRLNDALALRRIYPAIDWVESNTRFNENVKTPTEEKLDRLLRDHGLPKLGEEKVLELLTKASTCQDFIAKIEKKCKLNQD